jgi:hypothetical protein
MRSAVRALAAAAVVLAASLLPIRTAWSEPEVRLREVAVTAGVPVALPWPSSHLGVRWLGEHEDALELRWRPADGTWRAWEPVVVSHDLGDEDSGVVLSGLLGTDDAAEVEVRVLSGAPRSIEVVAIDTAHGPRHLEVAEATPVASAALNPKATVPQPGIIRRSEWGADESLRSGTPGFASITKMAVHHTATENNDPDPAATVRAILAYHTQSNGWNDIGYNFLIDASGRIYEGRYAQSYASGEMPTGENKEGGGVIGAHAGGNNTGSVGIALLGELGSVSPSAAAVESLKRMLAWKADRHGVDPMGTASWSTGELSTIVGHRDVSSTACPGDRLYSQLPALRRSVSDIIAASRAATADGYWLLARDTKISAHGAATSLPQAGGAAPAPPGMSVAITPSTKGYWVLSSNGRVTPYGDAATYGSTEGMRLNAPAVRLEPTPTGKGYWILGGDGGIFTFGDAGFFGSTGAMRLNARVISMATTPTGKGYWLLAADGGVFTFGDAAFHGSTGAMRLNAPVVSMAPHPTGNGYWLQAADGGIFSFGAVRFHGSVPGLGWPNQPRAVQIRVTPGGGGYYVLGVDGSVFSFGDARWYGNAPAGTTAVDLALKKVTQTAS